MSQPTNRRSGETLPEWVERVTGEVLTGNQTAAIEDIDTLLGVALEMRDLLREMEWSGEWCDDRDVLRAVCPVCTALKYRGEGHTPACRLGNLLQRMEGE